MAQQIVQEFARGVVQEIRTFALRNMLDGWPLPTPPNVRQQKGVSVEIAITADKVTSSTDEITTPQAQKARRIANFPPRSSTP